MADWRVAVLHKIGAPVTKQNLKFLDAWQVQEGGATHNTATYNWLNTTMGDMYPSINSVGVRAYPNFDVGTSYIAQTIRNGRYTNIVAGLRAGNPYKFKIQGDLSTWVSGSPTKGLGYASRVLGTKGRTTASASAGESPAPQQEEVKAPAQDLKKFYRSNLTKLSGALDSFVNAYQQTGEINNNSIGRLLGFLSSQGTVTPPKVQNAAPKTKTPQAAGVMSRVLAAAHKQVGQPYVWGGESRKEGGFDCSGLIQWAYSQVGINIPRVTYDQIKAGKPVSWGKFKPGDLIFSNKGGHVVMYVGGGKVIAAPRTGTVVQYQPVSRFKDTFVTARRIVD